jgi:hypothetical protein
MMKIAVGEQKLGGRVMSRRVSMFFYAPNAPHVLGGCNRKPRLPGIFYAFLCSALGQSKRGLLIFDFRLRNSRLTPASPNVALRIQNR